MGFLKRAKKRLGKGMKSVKAPFKKKRRGKKEKKKKGFLLFPCNLCCIGVIILLMGGVFIFGGGMDFFDFLPTIDENGFVAPPRAWDPTPDADEDGDEDDDHYYQLGLEFPVRCEDIDVLMVVKLYKFGGVGWIEDVNLAPIGLAVSSYDYKPGDAFFLDMFYGDAEYNISMSGVVNVEEAIYMTVYMNGVAIDEVVNVTWIADGSGIRYDYP